MDRAGHFHSISYSEDVVAKLEMLVFAETLTGTLVLVLLSSNLITYLSETTSFIFTLVVKESLSTLLPNVQNDLQKRINMIQLIFNTPWCWDMQDENTRFISKYDEALSHLILAGSDIILCQSFHDPVLQVPVCES